MKYFFLLLPVLLLSACAAMSGVGAPTSAPMVSVGEEKEASGASEAVPLAFFVEGKNRFDYQPGLECAAFSSAYLLRHYGQDADGLVLFRDFPCKLSDGSGVSPNGIVQLFKSKGYQAEFATGGTLDLLKEELAKGAPVIVFIHVEEPYTSPHNTHYIPLVGYDSEYVYFAESLDFLANCKEETGLSYNRKTEIEKFEKLWTDIDGLWDRPYFRISAEQGAVQ